MNVPADLLYTKDHEWARIEGKKAYVGITDYAQHSLGDITFVELPKPGAAVEQSKFCATVESVKAASEVYSPLTGKVVSVNPDAAASPELVNKDPYGKGYLFVMEFSDEAQKANLLDAAKYQAYVEGLAH
jgi:glycine cleavage system H protein